MAFAVRFVEPAVPALEPSCCASAFTCVIAAFSPRSSRGDTSAFLAARNWSLLRISQSTHRGSMPMLRMFLIGTLLVDPCAARAAAITCSTQSDGGLPVGADKYNCANSLALGELPTPEAVAPDPPGVPCPNSGHARLKKISSHVLRIRVPLMTSPSLATAIQACQRRSCSEVVGSQIRPALPSTHRPALGQTPVGFDRPSLYPAPALSGS